MKTIYKKLLFLFLLLPFGALAQSILSGTVVDSNTNQPLPGVNVVIQGAQNSTTTDFDGKFQLGGLKSGDKVVFSYIGYDPQTVNFSGQKSVSISLNESANQLQEVVVQVGYGSVKKKDATGSVSTVTAKDFNKGANVTAENLLNGRVAGLTVNSGGGSPGTGSEIRIRGGSSLFAKNDPLIILDGLPIENNSADNIGSSSILASINPSTIETFTVLKDASATAIYGSRASNGVIIITTKKGGKKLSVDYNFQYGFGRVMNTIDVFNSKDFVSQIEKFTISGALSAGSDTNSLGIDDPTNSLTDDLSTPGIIEGRILSNTNWQNQIYRRTDFVDNNVSIKGNLFNIIPSRLTLGNTYQEGSLLNNSFNRNNISLTINPSVFKEHLKFRVNANYSNERNRFATNNLENVIKGALRFDPTKPVRTIGDDFGGFFEYYSVNGNGNNQLTSQTFRNPVARLSQTFDNGLNNRIYGNIEADYKFHFFPDLRAVVNVGFDQSKGERSNIISSNAASSGANNDVNYGTDEFSTSLRKNKLLDAYFVYNKKTNNLNFDLTAGYSYQKFEAKRFISGNILDPNLAGGPTGFPQRKFDTDVVLIGFFGRSNLNFYDKYLFTLSYRRDGSSRFSDENRFGNFPAAAFAWKVNEDFFKNNSTISDLKLRLGWGITGQQDIPAANDYLQKINIGSGTSQYFFGPSITPIAITNRLSPKLKWEETTTYNVGLDYGLFKDRVTGTVDLFYKESKDLLVDAAVSDGSNFSNRAWQNVGNFTTKGIEFSINSDIIKTDNFNWNINLNATKFEREITKLIYSADIVLGDAIAGTGTNAQIFREGFSPYSFYVFKQLYDNQNRPIEGAFADLNGDGIINSSDKYIYKNPDPDVTFGFASTINYKNLDFYFNLRASLGNRLLNAVNAGNAYSSLLTTGASPGNIPTYQNETGFINANNLNSQLSDLYIENASYLKMDNITIGYTFPKWLDGKASLRLFTGMQNVFVLTKYSGLDPEVTNNGVDKTVYPRQRSVLFGINVKF